jgi:hypothetical protein
MGDYSGWDFGPGNMNDSGVSYDWETSGSSSGSSGFWSGLGQVAGGLLTTAGNTWSQKTLMQQAQQGQMYVEGQRAQYVGQAVGGISPLFMLLGAGLVFVLAIKK